MNLTLHLTTRCSLRCTYCYAPPAALRTLDMRPETALRAVDFAAEGSGPSCGIVFFGGEPLLARSLIREVVAHCRAREATGPTRFHFKVTTNGLALDEDFMDFAVREGFFIALSHDGAPAAHDRHRVDARGRGSHAAVERAAELLLRRQPYSPVLMTITPETVEHYAESVRALVEQGFRYIVASLDYAADWTRPALRTLRRQYERLAELYEQWTREERKFHFSPFEVKLASHIRGPEARSRRCELGTRQLSVAPDGGLYPCTQFARDGADHTYRLGDVWQGVDPERRRWLDALASRAHEPCGDCALEPRCSHTCGCLNWQATGAIDRVSPVLCEHERMLVPIVDALGARLYRRRAPMFLQKQYNDAYPVLSLIEDEAKAGRP